MQQIPVRRVTHWYILDFAQHIEFRRKIKCIREVAISGDDFPKPERQRSGVLVVLLAAKLALRREQGLATARGCRVRFPTKGRGQKLR